MLPQRAVRAALAVLLATAGLCAAPPRAFGGTVNVQPSGSGSTWTLTWPPSAGTSGYLLQTDGTGVTSWVGTDTVITFPLSSLLAATTTNSIDSTLFAQTWKWGTLSTQTALTLTSSSETTGTILNVSSSNAAATGYAGYFSQSGTGASYGIYGTSGSTGAGYGIYSAITGHGNTGYAGYFTNTDTGADANYGVYGTDASASGYGGYFANTSTGWALNATGTSYFNGSVGIGTTAPDNLIEVYANQAVVSIESPGNAANYGTALEFVTKADGSSIGTATNLGWQLTGRGNAWGGGQNDNFYFYYWNGTTWTANLSLFNSGSVGIGTTSPQTGYILTNVGGEYDTQSSSSYAAVSGANSGTGAGYGIYGSVTGAANTGYAGYFTNTATTANYGVYATTASTGAGFGIYSSITGASNTGYGVYGLDNSASGYGGYFANSSTGYALYASGNENITGSVQVGSTAASCASGNAGTVQYTGGVLKACVATGSSTYTWIPISSGMQLLGTLTASSSASLIFDSANSNWSNSYNQLYLTCNGLTASSSSGYIEVQIGESGTPTWETAGHYTYEYITASGASVSSGSSTTGTNLIGGNQALASATLPYNVQLWLSNPGSSSLYKMTYEQVSGENSSSALAYGIEWTYWNADTNPVTGLEVEISSGTISSGTCSLYGMN